MTPYDAIPSGDDRFRCPGCHQWRWTACEPCPNCGLGNAVAAHAGELAPLRRLLRDQLREVTADEVCRTERLDLRRREMGALR